MYIFVAMHMCSWEYSRNHTKKRNQRAAGWGCLGRAGVGRGARPPIDGTARRCLWRERVRGAARAMRGSQRCGRQAARAAPGRRSRVGMAAKEMAGVGAAATAVPERVWREGTAATVVAEHGSYGGRRRGIHHDHGGRSMVDLALRKMERSKGSGRREKGKTNTGTRNGLEEGAFSSCRVLQPGEKFSVCSSFSLLTWLFFLMTWILFAS